MKNLIKKNQKYCGVKPGNYREIEQECVKSLDSTNV